MTGFGENFSHKAVVLFQAQVYLPDGAIFVEGYGSLRRTACEARAPGRGRDEGLRQRSRLRKVRGARRTLLEFHLTP